MVATGPNKILIVKSSPLLRYALEMVMRHSNMLRLEAAEGNGDTDNGKHGGRQVTAKTYTHNGDNGQISQPGQIVETSILVICGADNGQDIEEISEAIVEVGPEDINSGTVYTDGKENGNHGSLPGKYYPGAGKPLSRREGEILGLLCQGATNREISSRFVISVNTVKTHIRHILRKLEANNRTHAVTLTTDGNAQNGDNGHTSAKK